MNNVQLTPEIRALLRAQRKRFIQKFGREPDPNEPVFFRTSGNSSTPEALTDREVVDETLMVMQLELQPLSYQFAFEYTAILAPTEKQAKTHPDLYAEWAEAVDAWETLEETEEYQEVKARLDAQFVEGMLEERYTNIQALSSEQKEHISVFPSEFIPYLGVDVLKECGINPDVDQWIKAKPPVNVWGTHLRDSYEDFLENHYKPPVHLNRNRDEWDWNKNLSSWRPEHIHLLSNAILSTLNMMDEDGAQTETTEAYLVDIAPEFHWSPQEIDPVVWKTHPFMTACKAMRFFSQYALTEEELSKVFPAKQLWLFDGGCFHALKDMFDLEKAASDLAGVVEPLKSEDWLVCFRLSRFRDKGKFHVGFVGNVFSKSDLHQVMRYLGGFDSREVDTSGFTPVPLIGQCIKEQLVPPDESGQLLAALIDFMQQKITLKIKKGIYSKKVKKRLEKKLGYVPEYTVMSLRSVEADEGVKEGAVGRKLMYRQLVREHYKNVCVGPKGRRRKLVLIDAYERGPEDAPLIPTKKSKKIVR